MPLLGRYLARYWCYSAVIGVIQGVIKPLLGSYWAVIGVICMIGALLDRYIAVIVALLGIIGPLLGRYWARYWCYSAVISIIGPLLGRF